MKTFGFFLATALLTPAWAQPTNLEAVSISSTQAVIRYTAPSNNACSLVVSRNRNYFPVVFDVDASMFTNADLDLSRSDTLVNGRKRWVTVGRHGFRDYHQALDGRDYPVALKAATPHYVQVTCDGLEATTQFVTANPPLGNGYGRLFEADPNNPGEYLFPYMSYTDGNQELIDPHTGVNLKRFTMPRHHNRDLLNQSFLATEMGTNWSNPNNLLSNADGGAFTAYSGTTQDWLYFRAPVTFWGASLDEVPWTDWFKLKLSAYCNGVDCSDPAARRVDVQFTFDGIHWGPTQQLTLPQGSEATVPLCGLNGPGCQAGDFWGFPERHREKRLWGQGLLVNSGSSATADLTDGADCDALRVGDLFYVAGTLRTVTALDCGAMPANLTMNAAINLAAPVDMAGWPFAYSVGWKDNAKLGFRIRKNSTTHTNAEHRIQYASFDMGRSDQGRSTSGGFADRCNQNLTENGNYLCAITDRMYSFNPTTGKAIIIGSMRSATSGIVTNIRGGSILGNITWDNNSARRLWSIGTESATGEIVILRCDIDQDDTIPNPWAEGPGNAPITDIVCVNMTPSASNNNIRKLVKAFDPNYNETLYSNWGLNSVVGSHNYLVIQALRGGQDSWGYAAVFDPGNNLPLGAGGTGQIIAGQYSFKMASSLEANMSLHWSSFHTFFNPTDAENTLSFQNTLLLKDENNTFNNSFYTVLQNYWDGDSWEPGLPVQPAGTLTELQISTVWNPAWGTQPTNFQPGDPLSDCINVTIACVVTDNEYGDRWHGKLAPGDLIYRTSSGPLTEYMQVTQVFGSGHIEVRRGIAAEIDASTRSPQAWAAGDRFTPRGAFGLGNPGFVTSSTTWNFIASPHGTDITAFGGTNWPGGGHQTMKGTFANSGPEYFGYVFPNGLDNFAGVSDFATDPAGRLVRRPFSFGTKTTQNSGECTEGHPSIPRPSNGVLRGLDSHPFKADSGNCFSTLPSNQPAAVVSWPVYKFSPPLSPKHFPTLNVSGDKLLRNISGPGAILTASSVDHWKMCVVLVAEECWAGSVAGEVYFSAPNLRPGQRFCSNNGGRVDDVCIGNMPLGAAKIVEYNTPTTVNPANWPYPATAVRELAGLNQRYRPMNTNHNVRLQVPDERWGYYNAEGSNRPEALTIEIPDPWSPDTVNRATFLPVPVTITQVPAGATRMLVKFGYDENLNCSENRNDPCYAVNLAVNEENPFLWETELTSTSGIDLTGGCSAGCKVTIPTLPNRIGYYRIIYKDAGGAVVFASPREAF